MTWYTHINRHVIDSNRKHNTLEPPIKVQNGKHGRPVYCHEVELPAGSRLVYDPSGDTILPCGARLVITSNRIPSIIR